ncbi:MAG: D-aminoacyl-tRNA deacylase [Saprospiraceae bacterium]
MRVIIQRVNEANLKVNNELICSINYGLLILVGIENEDTDQDIDWLSSKVIGLRIFKDSDDMMNLSLNEINGELMIVSQFTLYASTKKGNRPGFTRSAKPELAKLLYLKLIMKIKSLFSGKVVEGIFGADMKISLINDGPVTIIIDSKNKE